jgi:hypothetical protein
MRVLAAWAMMMGAAGLGVPSWGAIAYDSFGPGGGFTPSGSRWILQGTVTLAFPFTAAAGGRVEWIESGVQSASADAAARAFGWRFFADSGGLPGAALASFAAEAPFYGSVASGTSGAWVRHVPEAGATPITLVAGERYWLALSMAGTVPLQQVSWFTGSDSPAVQPALGTGGAWTLRPSQIGAGAARVSVPAPGLTVWIGAGALLAARRRLPLIR